MKQRGNGCRPRRAVLQLEALEARYAPAAGALDPTFDGDGKVTLDLTGDFDSAFAIAIQGDGKIVAAGRGGEDFALIRYNANGSLDTSFDRDGKVTTDFLGSLDFALGVAIQSDGKIVAAGRANVSGLIPDFALVRYNADGSLDSTFGSGGKVTTDFASGHDEATGIVIQADGKIVVAGRTVAGSNSNFALARYSANGSLDLSFGSGGKVTTNFANNDLAFDVELQADGKIVAAGSRGTSNDSATFDFALARYHANGSLDASFGSGGKVTTDFAFRGDIATDISIAADGKIVAAGSAGRLSGSVVRSDFALARYNSDGTLDTSFDSDGKVTSEFGTADAAGRGVAIQANGKIVVAGFARTTTHDFALARYNADGSLDTSFDVHGKVTTDFASDIDEAMGVALQAEGKIVVAGQAKVTAGEITSFDFAVARYEGDPTGRPPARPRPAISFAISAVDGQVYRHRLDLDTDTSSSWALTAPGQFIDIAVTEYGVNHAPVVFGLGIDHRIYEATFSVTGDLVSGWSLVAPGFFGSLDAGTYGNGNPFVVGVGDFFAANLQVFFATFDAQANLVAGWVHVAPGRFLSATIGQYGSGNVLIFGVDSVFDRIHAARFNSAGSMIDGWAHFAPGSFLGGTLAVGNRTNGTLELFAQAHHPFSAGDLRLYAANFSSSGLLANGFFEVPQPDPKEVGQLAVASLSNNHLKAFYGSFHDGRVFTAQFGANGVLNSGWTALSGRQFTFLDAHSQSGIVKLYAIDKTDSQVYVALFDSLGAMTDPLTLTAPGRFVNVRPAP